MRLQLTIAKNNDDLFNSNPVRLWRGRSESSHISPPQAHVELVERMKKRDAGLLPFCQ